MIYVLYIGCTDGKGRFKSQNWSEIIDWLKENTNNIRLDTPEDIIKIKSFYGDYAQIFIEEFPDPSYTYNSYRLWSLNDMLFQKIAESNFNVDTGIQFIYFLKDEDYLADLYIEDDHNYMFLHLSGEQAKELAEKISEIEKNIIRCQEEEDSINSLLEGSLWRALGD